MLRTCNDRDFAVIGTICLRAVTAVLLLSTLPSCTPIQATADIRNWEVESSPHKRFAISIPPGWLAAKGFAEEDGLLYLKQLADGSSLRCTASSTFESRLEKMSPNQIATKILLQGPLSLQRLSSYTSANSPSEHNIFTSGEVAVVNDYPATIYHYSTSTNGERKTYSQTTMETIYAVGRTYSVICAADALSDNAATRAFEDNHGVLAGALGSLVVFPDANHTK
jgi:hypothetical protein